MLSKRQKRIIVNIFVQTGNEDAFEAGLSRYGLAAKEYEDEIANLIYAIATNKPVPKQNG